MLFPFDLQNFFAKSSNFAHVALSALEMSALLVKTGKTGKNISILQIVSYAT